MDQGVILEIDAKTIVNRVLMRGVDGTSTLVTDMSIQDAMKVAKEQLMRSIA